MKNKTRRTHFDATTVKINKNSLQDDFFFF